MFFLSLFQAVSAIPNVLKKEMRADEEENSGHSHLYEASEVLETC